MKRKPGKELSKKATQGAQPPAVGAAGAQGAQHLFPNPRWREQVREQVAGGAIQGMAPTPMQQRHQNDLDGLNWIHKFGWLGSHHLGQLLWPGNASARHQADRLVRSWVTRQLVIVRDLPERHGRVFVLSAAGARLLTAHGVPATSGKDFGETQGQIWTPPSTWRHDQLAADVLVKLYLLDFDVLPEPHLRRTAGAAAKLPDGIAFRDDQVVHLEVELARKTGPSLRHQAEALCAVADGTAPKIEGVRPTHVMVAFMEDQQDERGHALDHRTRVSRAIAAAARRAVPVTWARCTGSSASTRVVRFSDDLIEADRAAPILRRLEASGWRPETGVHCASYGVRKAFIWEDEDSGCWAWQVDNLPAGWADTIRAAKRCCAEQLAALSQRH